MNDNDLRSFIDIASNAYPSMNINTPEEKENAIKRFLTMDKESPTANFYGLYRNNDLYGGMILHDFSVNLRGMKIKSGGVGFVAVDILHKKEKVAKELITYFLDHYKEKETYLALLYPFRPDFYKKMGFGYGTKINQYKLKPSSLPKGTSKKNVRFLTLDDKTKVLECYSRFANKTHGMIDKSIRDIEILLKNPNSKVVGYLNNENIEGYLSFSFKKDDEGRFLINDIHVNEFIYETTEGFQELMTFLNSQSDQIRYIVFNTQNEYFHYSLSDPRNGTDNIIPHVYHESNTQGIGLMYRIIDVKGLFNTLKNYNFSNINCKLKLNIVDSFYPDNNYDTIIHFNNGIPSIDNDEYDVEVSMDISDFSSLIMGCVNFKSLVEFGIANISDDNYINTINTLFATDKKPICMTGF